MMAPPGTIGYQRTRCKNGRASLSMPPHVGARGWEPSPRKLRLDSATIEKPKKMAVRTTREPAMFGSTCRPRTRCAGAPSASAAATYSRALTTRVSRARLAREARRVDDAERRDDAERSLSECADQRHGEQDRRKREQRVHAAHEDAVGVPTHISGEDTDGDACEGTEQHRSAGDEERQTRSPHDPTQQVSTKGVGAEWMGHARQLGRIRKVHRRRAREWEEWGSDRSGGDREHARGRAQCDSISTKSAPGQARR